MMLNASARNCSVARSPTFTLFANTRSRFAKPGPITVFLPTLPNCPVGGAANAAVLKYRDVLRSSPDNCQSTPGTVFGRTKIPPVPAPTPAVSPCRLIVNGNPLCSE